MKSKRKSHLEERWVLGVSVLCGDTSMIHAIAKIMNSFNGRMAAGGDNSQKFAGGTRSGHVFALGVTGTT